MAYISFLNLITPISQDIPKLVGDRKMMIIGDEQ